jgi:hypothetical protein
MARKPTSPKKPKADIKTPAPEAPPVKPTLVTEDTRKIIEYPPCDGIGSLPPNRWWVVTERKVTRYQINLGPYRTAEEAEAAKEGEK